MECFYWSTPLYVLLSALTICARKSFETNKTRSQTRSQHGTSLFNIAIDGWTVFTTDFIL